MLTSESRFCWLDFLHFCGFESILLQIIQYIRDVEIPQSMEDELVGVFSWCSWVSVEMAVVCLEQGAGFVEIVVVVHVDLDAVA